MPAHIRKGLITGAPAFNSGGLGLSIGSRVGGARHAISNRAPDSLKTNPPDTDYNISGYTITFNQLLTTRPYISRFIFSEATFPSTTPTSSSPLFPVELSSLTIEFKPTDPSGSDAVITVSITPSGVSPALAVDTLFTTVSKNVYSFTFPEILDAISNISDPMGIYRYTNGESDGLVSNFDTQKFTFVFRWIRVSLGDTDDFIRFTEMLNTIANKTYTFTMTENNKFNVASTVYSGTYTGVATI
jgi:hypothetical protein